MSEPPIHFKPRLAALLRRTGLLALSDRIKFHWLVRRMGPANAAFRDAHPDFPTPPLALAYDAYAHIDLRAYHDLGQTHAAYFAALIREHVTAPAPRVLEWGCGPARVLRHLPALLPAGSDVHGTDYNPASVAWCQATLPHLNVVNNQLAPPLPYADATFDAIYVLSVFTHLSEAMHTAWSAELARLLRPGGVLITTTHGDRYRQAELLPDEQTRYDRGELIVRGQVEEGKKWYAAFHPPSYVRTRMFPALTEVAHHPSPLANSLEQDVWVFRK
jgi:SAM-dependent methyltransferase